MKDNNGSFHSKRYITWLYNWHYVGCFPGAILNFIPRSIPGAMLGPFPREIPSTIPSKISSYFRHKNFGANVGTISDVMSNVFQHNS